MTTATAPRDTDTAAGARSAPLLPRAVWTGVALIVLGMVLSSLASLPQKART